MDNPATATRFPIPALCRGDRHLLNEWMSGVSTGSVRICVTIIIIGLALYGFTVGLWRGPEMAAYVSIKLPAAILLTLLVNGMLNGMLGLALGSGIGFRQSLQFLLAGFAIMAIVLGALSPVTFFLALNTPPADHPDASSWHSLTLLTHTIAIAIAGILSHRKLLSFVREFALTRLAGVQTFFAWLVGNLFVGAQITWILRPFFGTPGLEIQFLRPDPLAGNFYNTVLHSFLNLLGL
jgi:hypothetical protein